MLVKLYKLSHVMFPLLLLGFFCLGTSNAIAQQFGTIKGTVLETETSEPLPGANVSIVGTLRGSSVNVNGEYTIKVEPGVYKIRASFIGYETIEREVKVVAGETVTMNFQLAESPVEFGEALVVVGSRTSRTALETPVPVDVISPAEIRQSGQIEVNQMLATIAPSFNASHQTISDGTDHVNPASLRGLGPDQVLVLINGKRRHSSALVHVNGTFGRGTVGVDLNSIPKSAIDRIEILRDGAAAQYGSDAIAGVINIVLKEQTDNIEVEAMTGTTGEGDGDEVKLGANYGFKIGERGFFNITGEFFDRGRTNRSETYSGAIFTSDGANDEQILRQRGLTRDDFTMKTGQGKATVGVTFFNSAYSLTEDSEFYVFGGLSHRKGFATGFYRLPRQEERVVFEIFPNGFLPEIHTEIVDASVTAGIKGNHHGWFVDFSVTRGANSFQFNIENSNNASMGAASPTSFDAGRLKFRQTTGNLDIVREVDTKGVLESLSLAFGGEFRVENYQIEAGEAASYLLGNGGDRPGVDFDTTSTGAPKNPGSQVFPGFQPDNEVNRFRNSISIYGAIESQITDKLSLDIGGRFENYNDFGKRVIGKAAARYEVVENFAFRGAVSSGFRAPSLHQVWFNNVSIQFVLDPTTNTLEPSRVLTGSNKDPVTKAFGVPNLKEETSVNISAGFTARPFSNLSVTADYYRIVIDDRIVLSSRFSSSNPTVAKILKPFERQGVNAAQFFANAVDTETNGVDVVLSYFTRVGRGRLNLTGSANFTDTNVENVNVPESMVRTIQEIEGRAPTKDEIDAFANTLFNREERNRLEDALPRQKFNISARYTIGRFSVLGRGTFYGEIKYKPTNPANDETFSAKMLFDLDVSYEFLRGVKFSVGANNLFDTFPDKQTKAANLSSGRFPYSRRVTQFGMNGGFYYGRLQFNL